MPLLQEFYRRCWFIAEMRSIPDPVLPPSYSSLKTLNQLTYAFCKIEITGCQQPLAIYKVFGENG